MCTGQKYCNKCNVVYSTIGLTSGVGWNNDEQACLTENQFQQVLSWQDCPVYKSVNSKHIGWFGFAKAGYPDKGFAIGMHMTSSR